MNPLECSRVDHRDPHKTRLVLLGPIEGTLTFDSTEVKPADVLFHVAQAILSASAAPIAVASSGSSEGSSPPQ